MHLGIFHKSDLRIFPFTLSPPSSLFYLLLHCGSMSPQPAPASAGEESEEDQQFRTIFQEIAGEVSTNRFMTNTRGLQK